MGFMNLIPSFLGGMPMCHGAGGLAGQYYFGARTGGANIIEGSMEIFMGLLLGKSIHSLLRAFPVGIIGAMLFLVGVELSCQELQIGHLCRDTVLSVVAELASRH